MNQEKRTQTNKRPAFTQKNKVNFGIQNSVDFILAASQNRILSALNGRLLRGNRERKWDNQAEKDPTEKREDKQRAASLLQGCNSFRFLSRRVQGGVGSGKDVTDCPSAMAVLGRLRQLPWGRNVCFLCSCSDCAPGSLIMHINIGRTAKASGIFQTKWGQ